MKNLANSNSEALLDWVLNKRPLSLSEPKFEPIDVHLALAYARYGLADGSRSPSSQLIRPGSGKIINTLKKTSELFLSKNEKDFLQNVSIGFAKTPKADGYVYTNKVRETAIVINAGLFAGLFSANERYLQLEMASHGEVVEEDIDSLISKFNQRIASYLYDEPKPEEDWNFTKIWGRKRQEASWIWATTTAQQLFLLLHEFGHIQIISSSNQIICKDIYRCQFNDYNEEMEADKWAAKHIAKGMNKMFPKEPSIFISSIFLVFEYLELLYKMGVYKLGKEYPTPRKRFDNIYKIMGSYQNLLSWEILEDRRENFNLSYQVFQLSNIKDK